MGLDGDPEVWKDRSSRVTVWEGISGKKDACTEAWNESDNVVF